MRKLTHDEFVAIANEKHNGKYEYPFPYQGAKTVLPIKCLAHGLFEQTAGSHMRGTRCPACVGLAKLTNEQFLLRAREVHGNKYAYPELYKNMHSKMPIICPNHELFYQTTRRHLIGQGCPICGINKLKTTNAQFLERANKLHNGKYEYPEPYVGSEMMMPIICPEHGVFHQTPHSHLQGSGCPRCNNHNKLTNNEFLERAREIHGDTYKYPKPYINMETEVPIECYIHGIFNQFPDTHLKGSGCSKCAQPFKQLTHEQFLKQANSIHENRYSYPEKFVDAHQKMPILCPDHGLFNQTPYCHLSGQGCVECGHIRGDNLRRRTYDEFVEEARTIHGDIYEYPVQLYIDPWTPFQIRCPVHNIFEQIPQSHLAGYGCNQCSIDRTRKTHEQFVEEANLVHNSKYTYTDLYLGVNYRMNISCQIHGLFSQNAGSHLGGCGCPKCSPNANKGKDRFVAEAREVHGDRYGYPGEYIDSYTKLPIDCSNHGIFWQRPHSHLIGQGCPKCGFNVSEPETEWLNSLGIPEELRNNSMRINGRRIIPDAYDPVANIVYEFHGDYYHGNPIIYSSDEWNERCKKTHGELYRATMEKEKLIRDGGYSLIIMWELDWKIQIKQQK